MAKKKKTAIGDLIKSDMSRRAIGEEPVIIEKVKPAPARETEKKPSEKKPLAVKPSALPGSMKKLKRSLRV